MNLVTNQIFYGFFHKFILPFFKYPYKNKFGNTSTDCFKKTFRISFKIILKNLSRIFIKILWSLFKVFRRWFPEEFLKVFFKKVCLQEFLWVFFGHFLEIYYWDFLWDSTENLFRNSSKYFLRLFWILQELQQGTYCISSSMEFAINSSKNVCYNHTEILPEMISWVPPVAPWEIPTKIFFLEIASAALSEIIQKY